MDILGIFNTVRGIIANAPKVIAEAPHFVELVHGVLPIFNGAQQDELKSALAAARERSDAAQADFVQAGRGR